jgi:hypothetical protein
VRDAEPLVLDRMPLLISVDTDLFCSGGNGFSGFPLNAPIPSRVRARDASSDVLRGDALFPRR